MIISERTSRRSLLFLLVILLWAPILRADYLWPLPASNELTSNFCAFRGGHYHSGIDIRTFAKTGYDVVAVEDGYLWRVSSNWWGYGNAAYLMLDDGNIAVYGHLQEFAPPVEKYVRQTEWESRSFKVNLFPEKDRFRFKKGDLVGKSGQSGSGAPHLHFEIRNADNMPVDPTSFYPRLKDSRAPRFEEITFRALDPESFIDGRACPVSQKFEYNEAQNNYSMAYMPVLSGKIGLEIKAADYRNGVSRNYNIAAIKFYLNDSLVFETTYDTLNFDSWNSIDQDYNHYQRIADKDNYHNLYYPDGLRSSQQNTDKNCPACSGTPINEKLAPGIYNAKIVALDFRGNPRTALFKVEITPQVRFGYKVLVGGGSSSGNQAPLDSYNFSAPGEPDLIARVSVYDPASGNFMLSGTVNPTLNQTGHSITFALNDIYKVINASNEMYRLARLDFLDGHKAVSSYLLGIGMNPDRRFLDSNLVDAVDFVDSIKFIRSEPHVQINIRSLYDFLSKNNLHANFAERIEGVEKIEFPLKLQRPLTEFAYGEGFSTLINYLVLENLLRNGYFLYRTGDSSGFSLNNLKVDFSPDLPVDILLRYKAYHIAGDSSFNEISLKPDDRLMIQGITLTFLPPSSYPLDKTAIYGISRGGGASYLGNKYDKSGRVSAIARSLGTYRIMVDTVPPVIRNIYPGNNSTISTSRPNIHFFMDDKLTGFDSDTLLTVTLDDRYVVSEYDVDNKIVYLHLGEDLKPGQHSLKIVARDVLGNTTVKESNFHYASSPKK